MTSGMVLALIILTVLTASLWYIINAEGGVSKIPVLLNRVGIHITIPDIKQFHIPTYSPRPNQQSSVPAAFQSGNSRYSHGTCSTVSDCAPAGCSQEVCSNDANITTTCEYSESFPNIQGYSCTCLPTGVCGWNNKKAIYD